MERFVGLSRDDVRRSRREGSPQVRLSSLDVDREMIINQLVRQLVETVGGVLGVKLPRTWGQIYEYWDDPRSSFTLPRSAGKGSLHRIRVQRHRGGMSVVAEWYSSDVKKFQSSHPSAISREEAVKRWNAVVRAIKQVATVESVSGPTKDKTPDFLPTWSFELSVEMPPATRRQSSDGQVRCGSHIPGDYSLEAAKRIMARHYTGCRFRVAGNVLTVFPTTWQQTRCIKPKRIGAWKITIDESQRPPLS